MKVEPIRFLDNTMLGDYKKCPRYFYLRHIRYWRISGTALPLAFGLAWHEAMDALWRGYQLVPDGSLGKTEALVEVAHEKFLETWVQEGLDPSPEVIDDYGARNPFVAKEMLYGYLRSRQHILAQCELIAVEQPIAFPLYPGDKIWYIGRLDKVIRWENRPVVLEHKTTTEYKKDGGFKSTWIDQWYMSDQCEGYLFGANAFYEEGVRQLWVDGALVHAKEHDAFKFVPISAGVEGLDEWLSDVREWHSRIEDSMSLLAYDKQPEVAFPRNRTQCINIFGKCQFFAICTTTHSLAEVSEPPSGYLLEKWEPFDVLHIEKLGLEKLI